MADDGKEIKQRKHIYSAIALENSLVLEFSRSELDKIFKKKEKHIIETKKNFLL